MTPRTRDGGYLLVDPPPPFGKLCAFCRHFVLSLAEDGRPTCRAFPYGIPDQILVGRADHRRPFPGDRGIRYEPSSEAVRHGTAPPMRRR